MTSKKNNIKTMRELFTEDIKIFMFEHNISPAEGAVIMNMDLNTVNKIYNGKYPLKDWHLFDIFKKWEKLDISTLHKRSKEVDND